MDKALETLKTIRHIHDSEHGKDQSMDERFDTIEKELKLGTALKKFVRLIGGEIKEEDFDKFALEEINEYAKHEGFEFQFTSEEIELLKGFVLCH